MYYTLPTVTLFKGDEKVIVNASDEQAYLAQGYTHPSEAPTAADGSQPAESTDAEGDPTEGVGAQ